MLSYAALLYGITAIPLEDFYPYGEDAGDYEYTYYDRIKLGNGTVEVSNL